MALKRACDRNAAAWIPIPSLIRWTNCVAFTTFPSASSLIEYALDGLPFPLVADWRLSAWIIFCKRVPYISEFNIEVLLL
jgi:hypothetical protein